MTVSTFGDMAQFLTLRRDGANLRSDVLRLTSELASGRTSDLGQALGGNFSNIADITRSQRLNTSFSASIAEAASSAAARQAALERVSSEIDGFAPQILSTSSSGSLASLQINLAGGTDRLEQAVSALNTRLAGRSLFSADDPTAAPLISGEAIMAELRTAVAGTTDASTVEMTVRAWFTDPAGGYETLAWQGGDGDPPEILLGEGISAKIGISALEPAIRESLIGLSLAALASEQAAPLPEDEFRALAAASAEQMLRSENDMIELRARLGTQEARIEEARVSSQAARSSLDMEYNRLIEADPYQTATELEAVNTRLESLYILTARMSRLSLTEYLR